METTTNSAQTLSAKTYVINSYGGATSCSPYLGYFGLLHDAARDQAWETFGAPSLPIYFNRGMDKFYETVDTFADLSQPFSAEIEKQLPFMLESLLYVRRLISEIEEPK